MKREPRYNAGSRPERGKELGAAVKRTGIDWSGIVQRNTAGIAVVGLALMVLAGCVGKSPTMPDVEGEPVAGRLNAPGAEEVREHTGAEPPPPLASQSVDETVLGPSDGAFLMSDLISRGDEGGITRFQTSCSGPSCTLTSADGSQSRQIDPFEGSDTEELDDPYTYGVIGWYRGVLLFSQLDESNDAIAYMGSMGDSIFGVTGAATEEAAGIASFSAGYATKREAVSGGATWEGVMLGADVSDTERWGNVIVGDAEIAIPDFTDPKANVTFANVRDLAAESDRDDMEWTGISVGNGGFAEGGDEDSIEGRFYGTRRQEVGGIFERDQVVGAFGAAIVPGDQPVLSTPWAVEPAKVRELTGAAAPDFTDGEVPLKTDALKEEADSLLMSDFLIFHGGGGLERWQTVCSEDSCTTVGDTRLSPEDAGSTAFAGAEGEDIHEEHRAVGVHRGVSLGQRYAETAEDSYRSYGGWLSHSLFGVQGLSLEDYGVGGIVSYSTGAASGSNPVSGGGTWTGVMVGADVSGTGTNGHNIQGDAAIRIADFADPKVGVSFAGIYDLDTGEARASMTWSEIRLSDGSFRDGEDGDSIEGRFYGPGHEEVGGIFERDRVVGAFGASRERAGP